MLKPNVLNALGRQIQQELTASQGYLALSVWFEQQMLKGFAQFFRKQADEERQHALRILDYVQDRNAAPTLSGVDAPKTEFGSVVEALKHAREAERHNTASINALYELAIKENDLATQEHLNWFVKEQVEEERWAEDFVAMAEKVAGSPGSLFMLDHRVSKVAE